MRHQDGNPRILLGARGIVLAGMFAPYVELADLGPDGFETDAAAARFESTQGINTVTGEGTLPASFAGGSSLSMASRVAGRGELRVQFTLYPGMTFLEIGFGFTNLDARPVRLRRVEVIDGGRFLPGGPSDALRLLARSRRGTDNLTGLRARVRRVH